MKKIVFSNLQVNDYIHPDEIKIFNNSDNKTLIDKGLNTLNDVSVSMVRKITLGKYIKLTKNTAPHLIEILENTCKILDFPKIPSLYECHEADHMVLTGGTDNLQITMSDYIIENFDDNMFYFLFGNAISMFKGNHTRLATICSVINGIQYAAPFKLILQTYLRAADLSSDRGGLLACQDFSVAAKCILWDIGMPITDLNNMSEKEIIMITQNYIRETEMISKGKLSDIATLWKKVNSSSSPAYTRLNELYLWYKDGYFNIIDRWK